MDAEIRSERPADAAGIRRVLEEAFGRPDEARIGEALRERDDPVISLVALVGKKLVGHILCVVSSRLRQTMATSEQLGWHLWPSCPTSNGRASVTGW